MSGIKLMTAAGLLVTAVAFAQPPKNSPPQMDDPAKDSLEQLLAKALQQSPEIQVAEAKLREAEANLRQTRLQLAQSSWRRATRWKTSATCWPSPRRV